MIHNHPSCHFRDVIQTWSISLLFLLYVDKEKGNYLACIKSHYLTATKSPSKVENCRNTLIFFALWQSFKGSKAELLLLTKRTMAFCARFEGRISFLKNLPLAAPSERTPTWIRTRGSCKLDPNTTAVLFSNCFITRCRISALRTAVYFPFSILSWGPAQPTRLHTMQSPSSSLKMLSCRSDSSTWIWNGSLSEHFHVHVISSGQM